MYFIYLYENRIMKTAAILLSGGRKEMRENDGGDEPNQDTL
jgi:hypothetical protein